VVGGGNMLVMTNRTTRLALPVLLAGGLALSACSFSGGTEDGEASSSPTTTAASSPTTPAAPTAAAPSSTGSAPAVTAAPEPSGADPTTAGGPDRCHTSELTGSLAQGDAAAGNRYATLTLTNTGGEVCTVYGYGGIGLVAQDGSAAPTQQVRVDPAPRTVTLQPGQAVAATLHWTVVATGSEPTTGDCEPTPGRLTVIPPDETDSLSVTWSYGPVCGAGQIEQSAYVAA
jgi:hypothetical protein